MIQKKHKFNNPIQEKCLLISQLHTANSSLINTNLKITEQSINKTNLYKVKVIHNPHTIINMVNIKRVEVIKEEGTKVHLNQSEVEGEDILELLMTKKMKILMNTSQIHIKETRTNKTIITGDNIQEMIMTKKMSTTRVVHQKWEKVTITGKSSKRNKHQVQMNLYLILRKMSKNRNLKEIRDSRKKYLLKKNLKIKLVNKIKL